ncbi:MAG: family 78 glycoside hydrolase catalytic domain [Bacteroidales bacterium]|nr:family 78 glycoside hydrolase catalytic domain [Bacteroidales bacterium]
MKKSLLLFLLSSLVGLPNATAGITVFDLSIEGRTDQPLGLDLLQPRLGWRMIADANEKNIEQTAYHIQVADSREELAQGKANLWECEVQSGQSLYIPYEGHPLQANQRCFWRVRVKVKGEGIRGNKYSDWSDISEWGVGLLNEGNWRGRWIGLDQANDWDVETEHSRLSARYFRTRFETLSEVKRATLHIAGLGLYEASLNGKKIGNDVMTPAPTDYTHSIIYNTYDVSDLLKEQNLLDVTVSNGRFYTMQQNKKKYKIANFGYPTLRANLIIEYKDGTSEVIATDEKKWQMTCNGAIRSSNEYDGEIYDANHADLSADSLWTPAPRSAIPQGELIGNVTPAMKVVDTLQVHELVAKTDGRLILDFGQNFAGWVRTDVSALGLQAGDTLRLRYAEKLTPDGELYVANLRHAQSTDYYIAHGKESLLPADKATWAPRFATHGGQFVEVCILRPDGTVAPYLKGKKENFTAEVVADDMQTLYSFHTQNETLNRLVRNAYWGILDNYKGMPIDCPQRDERMPWLGDRSQGCWGESYLLDNHHLYNKWLRDIEESQRTDGCIPDVAPAYWNYYSDNVSWPSVFVFGAEMLYRQFGDDKAIVEHYPAMRKWLLHFFNQKMDPESGLIVADKYGDWCVTPEAAEMIHSQDESRKTDGKLIGSCYAYRLLGVLMEFDDILLQKLEQMDPQQQLAYERRGFSAPVLRADREEYGQLRDTLKANINRHFLTVKEGTSPAPDHALYPDSIFYANNAVTANLLPLAFGIVPEEYAETISRQIQAKILLNPADGHLCCGVIGISWLLRELSKQGRMDIAYLLATNKTYPSWGYMLENGATTIWELWNGNTANPAMNSGNHVMLLGDLLPWCFEHIGGIRSEAAGFKQIRLAPNFELEELSSAEVSYLSPYGRIVSNWQKSPMHLTWDIEIPANTSATVVTPNGEKTYGSGKWHIEEDLPHKELPQTAKLQADTETTVIANEFLYEKADFPSCHAASIAECANGDLLATYFGGSYEGCPDMCIWTQRKKLLKRGRNGKPNSYEKGWSIPVLVADGTLLPEDGKGWREWAAAPKHTSTDHFIPATDAKTDTLRKACYNPVLFQVPGGDLILFYKLGKDVRDWTGYLMYSKDNGYTWTQQRDSIPADPTDLFLSLPGHSVAPDSLLGAIKNQPILLPKGFRCKNGQVIAHDRILSPTSKETATASKIKAGYWRCYVELSEDGGKTWTLGPVVPCQQDIRTIQPALLVHPDGRIQMLCRTASPPKDKGERARIATSFSEDGGLTWSQMQLVDDLPNNNSGIDAVTLPDGTFALIYNPFGCVDWRDKKDPNRNKPLRNPLYVATSTDGLHWTPQLVMESSPISQYSYPSMIVGSDGTLHCIYTWRRQRIKYQRIQIKRD